LWSGGKVFLLNARITAVREVARGMFVVSMVAPEIADSVRAGQFVNLGWAGAFLRRPFSVYRVVGEGIEIVLKAVGRGTSQLIAMRPGDAVSCLGPLGHGFDLVAGPRSAVLVSGGLGVAPMPLAAREARALGMRVTWVHGARSSDELCSETEGDDVIWATDDGSRGVAGTAVAAAPEGDVILACGLKRLSRWRRTWDAAPACASAAPSHWLAGDTTARAKKVRSTEQPASTGQRFRHICPTP